MTDRKTNERKAIRALAASVVMISVALGVVVANHPNGPIFLIALIVGGCSILSICLSIIILQRKLHQDRWHGPL